VSIRLSFLANTKPTGVVPTFTEAISPSLEFDNSFAASNARRWLLSLALTHTVLPFDEAITLTGPQPAVTLDMSAELGSGFNFSTSMILQVPSLLFVVVSIVA